MASSESLLCPQVLTRTGQLASTLFSDTLRAHMTKARGVLPTILVLVSIFSDMPVARGATNTFREWKRPVMTWVPPYAVSQCKARLTESFGGRGMKDALTHLGLQFWKPTKN